MNNGEFICLAMNVIRYLSKTVVGSDMRQMGLFTCIQVLLYSVQLATTMIVGFTFCGELEKSSVNV